MTILLAALLQMAQNPSPMVEHVREHPRLIEQAPPGERITLEVGTLFVPRNHARSLPLLVHFHGAPWIAEVAGARRHMAVIAIQIGAGSSVYAKPFRDPALFTRLLAEAESKSGLKFRSVTLSSWSAGYGAIREILKTGASRIDRIVAVDSIHAGYQTIADDMTQFVAFANSGKPFLLTHSEVFPGTFASTTETADHLLEKINLKQKAVLRWGPMRMQQISEARRVKVRVMGFAGNSAPDHVDQLHALPDLLKLIR